MGTFLVIGVAVIATWAVVFAASTVFRATPDKNPAPQDLGPTVTLTGDIMMVSHDALHHPVAADVIAVQGRRTLGVAHVAEDNTFSMQISAEARGEIEVKVALHGASTSLVTADGQDLHAVVIYNPVNNFFA